MSEIKDQPARERLVRAAADLFQRQGYAATGLSEILARSRAPKGSLYHYFPGGKRDLALAAAEQAGAAFAERLNLHTSRSISAGAAIFAFAHELAGWLEASNHQRGCPIAMMALELAPRDSQMADALSAVFGDWEALIRERIEADAIAPEAAARLARLTLCTLEGSLILARAARSAAPVLKAADDMAALIEAARA